MVLCRTVIGLIVTWMRFRRTKVRLAKTRNSEAFNQHKIGTIMS